MNTVIVVALIWVTNTALKPCGYQEITWAKDDKEAFAVYWEWRSQFTEGEPVPHPDGVSLEVLKANDIIGLYKKEGQEVKTLMEFNPDHKQPTAAGQEAGS